MKNKKITFGFGILLALALTACTDSLATGNLVLNNADSQAEIKEVTISLHNWELKQQGSQINKGDKVRLRVKGVSGLHGIMIPELQLSTGIIGPGQEEILEFEATQSGTFDYYCSVYCGEEHARMTGRLTIQEEVNL